MSRILLVIAVIATVAVCAVWANSHPTPVEQCKGTKIEDLSERVVIKPCGKTRCKFHKGSSANITLRFKPTHEIKELTLDVFGKLGDAQLPFIGVTGTSACKEVVNAESGEPAPCPLAADVEYSYTRSFPVEPFYPSLSVVVHWALNDGKDDVICFEAPIVIK